jgi:hypothetical protein
MNRIKKQGIIVDGSIKSAGVTFFTRGGKTIVRSATSRQPKRRTEKQFVLRERLAHCNSLWFSLSSTCSPLLTARSRPYDCFMSLAAKLPAVFLTQGENANGAALLMPGIPVSCGSLEDIAYSLGLAEGSPALLTGLQPADLGRGDSLLLVELRQTLAPGFPYLDAMARKVGAADFTEVDGHLALLGDSFADPMRGWALVRRRGDSCSSQTVVTAATLYRAYQSGEALLRAADSYGGLTTSSRQVST